MVRLRNVGQEPTVRESHFLNKNHSVAFCVVRSTTAWHWHTSVASATRSNRTNDTAQMCDVRINTQRIPLGSADRLKCYAQAFYNHFFFRCYTLCGCVLYTITQQRIAVHMLCRLNRIYSLHPRCKLM